MTRVDAVAAANLLRRLRESRGWSWAELARALRDCAEKLRLSLQGRQVGSIQRAIARWESPSEQTSPGQHYQVLLAHLYAHCADGAFALGPGSDFEMLVEALCGFGVTEQRVEALVEMVTRTAAAPSNRATAKSGAELVSQVDAAVTRICPDRVGPAGAAAARARPDRADLPTVSAAIAVIAGQGQDTAGGQRTGTGRPLGIRDQR